MNSLEMFFTVCAVLAVGLPVCLWQIHRAWRAEQAKNSDPYDVGIDPGDPRLPAGINRFLDDYAALDPDLRHVFGPDAPAPTTTEGNS